MIVLGTGHSPFEDNWAAPLYRAYARRVRMLYIHPDSSPFAPWRAHRWRSRIATSPTSGDGGSQGGSQERPQSRQVEVVWLPAFLPGNRWGPIALFNRWLGLRLLIGELRRRVDPQVVLLSLRPDLVPGHCGATLRVYGITDNYAALSPEPTAQRRVEDSHRHLLRVADLVWTTADSLAQTARQVRDDVLESSNGVDFDAFSRGAELATPEALGRCPRPRVGLVGRLNDRLDWELIEALCHRRPDLSVVLVGPVYEAGPDTRGALARLAGVANFRHLEGIPEDDMPRWVAAFDVCLIPYRRTPATLDINPLKLYQSLAAGRPVVSTPLPAVFAFDDTIAIADDVAGFEAAIDQALVDAHDPAAIQRRRQRVESFDWQTLADTQLSWVRDRLT